MNRRQKIIVSVTGIFLVMLILMGLTYAYFLTRVNGNPNNTSISVTTADLKLDWIDGTDKIIDSTAALVPGEFESTINFSVKNNGNVTVKDYGVVLKNLSIKWASTVPNTIQQANVDTNLAHPQDFRLLITCDSDKVKSEEEKCKGVDTYLPTTDEILLTNNIDPNETQEYTVTLKYVDWGEDQSADMNKAITAKLDIIDTKNTTILTGVVENYEEGDVVQSNSTPRVSTIDKYGNYKIIGLEPGNHTVRVKDKENEFQGLQSISVASDTKIVEVNIDRLNSSYSLDSVVSNPYQSGTLAYEIINNAQINKNGTKLLSKPETTVAESISQYETKEYVYELIPTNSSDGDISYLCIGDTIEEAKTCNKRPSDYNDAVGKYVHHYWYFWTKYLISYDAVSSELKFKSIQTINEKTLSVTEDDYGTSYYFRGDIEDNYVNFAGMCWRIVRIEGDGSTKLILEDSDQLCNSKDTNGNLNMDGNWNDGQNYIFGYNDDDKPDLINYSGQNGLQHAFKTFQTRLATNLNGTLETKLKKEEWCFDNTLAEARLYGAYVRLRDNNPSLKCTSTKLTKFNDNSNMYVGTLTVDEMIFAGSTSNKTYYDFYLMNEYAKENNLSWVSLSPATVEMGEGMMYRLVRAGSITGGFYASDSSAARPAITLAAGLKLTSGDGTQSSPYTI